MKNSYYWGDYRIVEITSPNDSPVYIVEFKTQDAMGDRRWSEIERISKLNATQWMFTFFQKVLREPS